jgi:hypothetical protein
MSDLRIGLLAMKGGVVGSAMTDRLDQRALKFREVLKATERMEADQLEAYQRQLLEPLLAHARKFVPFYAKGWLTWGVS